MNSKLAREEYMAIRLPISMIADTLGYNLHRIFGFMELRTDHGPWNPEPRKIDFLNSEMTTLESLLGEARTSTVPPAWRRNLVQLECACYLYMSEKVTCSQYPKHRKSRPQVCRFGASHASSKYCRSSGKHHKPQ